MKRYAWSIAFCLLSVSGAIAQPKSPVEGVWKIAEEARASGKTNSNPQPSLIIFTKGYYSEVYVMGEQPRPPVTPAKDPQNLTDAEKIARYDQWRPFAANSGTYEIKGSTLTRRVIVSKNANLITREHVQEFKVEDPNTLWLIPIAAESATDPRIKLTRLE